MIQEREKFGGFLSNLSLHFVAASVATSDLFRNLDPKQRDEKAQSEEDEGTIFAATTIAGQCRADRYATKSGSTWYQYGAGRLLRRESQRRLVLETAPEVSGKGRLRIMKSSSADSRREQALRRFLDRDAEHLETRTKQELGAPDKRARRVIPLKVGTIDAVERVV